MSIHDGTVIVLDNVTEEQLDLIKVEVEKLFMTVPEPEMGELTNKDMLWSSLFNLCCDLDIEGYEI